MSKPLKQNKAKKVKVLVLGEWSVHSNGVSHIDLLVEWVREIAHELKLKSGEPTVSADVRRIRIPTGKFIPSTVLAELTSAHIVIADITTFRPRQSFNLNVAYEIGVVNMLRYENHKKNPEISESRVAPYIFSIVIDKKSSEIRNAFTNLSGLAWGTYSLKAGLAGDLKKDIANKLRLFKSILNNREMQ